MRNFGLLLEVFEQAVPSLIGASDIVPQLRLLKRNEITQALAGKLRFVVKPWHRIVANCHDQTPEITGPHA